MLKTQSLFFAYNQHIKFNFPDIELAARDNLLILGESGAGKTTLLHLIAGLLQPKSGTIELSGTFLQELSTTGLDRFRGRNIGLVFQKSHFIQSLSLQENLAMVQYLAGKPQDKNLIKEVLNNLAIGHKIHDKPRRLSHGEQQRAAIAAAVINSPQFILADEPTSSLDDKNCLKAALLLKEQALTTEAQLIIITHDQRLKDHFQNMITL